MTFVEAAKAPLLKYSDFSGRSSRREYWSFQLAVAVALGGPIGLAFVAIEIAVYASDFTAVAIAFAVVAALFLALYLMAIVMLIVPWLAVCVRRLHDTNRSGNSLLLVVIPFGILVVLDVLVTAGDPGVNQYGPNPNATAADS